MSDSASPSNNTATSFSDKWHKNPGLAFAQTLNESSDIARWIVTRNGFENLEAFGNYLIGRKRILDGGCGNGRVTAMLRAITDPAVTEVVGIDLVAADVAAENLADAPNVRIEAGDLLGDLSGLGEFDFIYSQEVLHHTGDPRGAFLNLAGRLAPDGELAIYVYKKKAPLREHADDLIRDRIAGLSYEEAMAACRQVTELGRVLSELPGEIDIPAVDVLEIPAGKYTFQRFIYHFFAKCFWNDEFGFEDNAVINYDWYHPQDCTRHTADEVREWFAAAGLEVNQFFEDFYGITARGKRVAG